MPKLPNSLAAATSSATSSATYPEAFSAKGAPQADWSPPAHRANAGGTWASDNSSSSGASNNQTRGDHEVGEEASPTAQVLSLFADPRISELDAPYAASQLKLPTQDIQNILGALTQAGYLERRGDMRDRFALNPDKKAELEHLYMHTLREVHQEQGLALPGASQDLQQLSQGHAQGQEDDPRMPMTAGILSLFLPGTGQLLNGDIGRAVLVFAIWALAILAPHPAIIIFVRLYAGAEAFFNAKLRRLAQRRALEAAAEQRAALGPASPALPAPGVGS